MTEGDERDAVERVCGDAGLDTPEGWLDYFRLTKQWGARTDLTSARTDAELAEILFVDAAQLIVAGWTSAIETLVDVGAGVGAPTLPLVVAERSLEAVLVEPRRIRTAFLRTAVGSLSIGPRATVLETRVDPRDPTVAGAPFEVGLSRATFSAAEWRRIGAELASEVWVLVAGAEPDEPTEFDLCRRLDYVVPSSQAPRAVLAYRRRRAGMI